jgi:hypothetical protein
LWFVILDMDIMMDCDNLVHNIVTQTDL